MKISTNFLTQVLSVVLWAFVLAGLKIDPSQTADTLINSFSGSSWALAFIAVANLANSIWQWVKTIRAQGGITKDFWAFLRSTNWWTSFANIVVSGLALLGVQLPPDLAGEAVRLVFERKWLDFAVLIGGNVVNILVHFFTKNKA